MADQPDRRVALATRIQPDARSVRPRPQPTVGGRSVPQPEALTPGNGGHKPRVWAPQNRGCQPRVGNCPSGWQLAAGPNDRDHPADTSRMGTRTAHSTVSLRALALSLAIAIGIAPTAIAGAIDGTEAISTVAGIGAPVPTTVAPSTTVPASTTTAGPTTTARRTTTAAPPSRQARQPTVPSRTRPRHRRSTPDPHPGEKGNDKGRSRSKEPIVERARRRRQHHRHHDRRRPRPQHHRHHEPMSTSTSVRPTARAMSTSRPTLVR